VGGDDDAAPKDGKKKKEKKDKKRKASALDGDDKPAEAEASAAAADIQMTDSATPKDDDAKATNGADPTGDDESSRAAKKLKGDKAPKAARKAVAAHLPAVLASVKDDDECSFSDLVNGIVKVAGEGVSVQDIQAAFLQRARVSKREGGELHLKL
jgi:hypothetical protein